MEEKTYYTVKITPQAEAYYYSILEYFYAHLTEESANTKSAELLELAISLDKHPLRGTIEENLHSLGRNHRFILYYYTQRNAIKIIYFIDHKEQVVYVTDFFPCESDDNKIHKRNNT